MGVLRIALSHEMCRTSRKGHGHLVEAVAPTDTSSVTDGSAGSASAGDAIVGYRAFVAVVVAAYFTYIALTHRLALRNRDYSSTVCVPGTRTAPPSTLRQFANSPKQKFISNG
jgi:hypothetical protein